MVTAVRHAVSAHTLMTRMSGAVLLLLHVAPLPTV